MSNTQVSQDAAQGGTQLSTDQNFFLELARGGKEKWNKWRQETGVAPPESYARVLLSGIDFRKQEHSVVNFEEFDFGDGASFVIAQFGEDPYLWDFELIESDVPVPTRLSFRRATFGDRASFVSAVFHFGACFEEADFGGDAHFSCSYFRDGPVFRGSTFGAGADFYTAIIGDRCDFSEVIFERITWSHDGLSASLSQTSFAGAIFGAEARFSNAYFRGDVSFAVVSEDRWKNYREHILEQYDELKRLSEKNRRRFINYIDDQPQWKTLSDGNFSGARFDGVVDFSGRKFDGNVDFTNTIFNQPPIFDECEGVERLDLYGARIRFSGKLTIRAVFGRERIDIPTPGWTTDSAVALRLRRLRRLAEELSNHDLERDLYIEERKAERGIFFAQYWKQGCKAWLSLGVFRHSLWVAIMFAYWIVSNYGRSVFRPFVALTFSVFLFHSLYFSLLTPAKPTEQFDRVLWAFTISNTLPFVGGFAVERDAKASLLCASETSSPCTSIPPWNLQILTGVQSIFGAMCLFFVGLALRNFFKMR